MASSSASGKVALVTAGGKRLGKAISLKLAQLGYDIALHYNTSENDAKKTALEIEALGKRCFCFQNDLSHPTGIQNLVTEAIKSLGSLDALVNNASVFSRSKLLNVTAEAVDLDFQIHVKAPMFLMQAFAKTGVHHGLAINMVDTNVSRIATDYFSYLLSKKSLLALTEMAANELAPRIRVNAIAPGIVLPPEYVDRIKHEDMMLANPLQRAGSPEDIVAAVEYLVRNESVTGQCLFVDSGDHINV